MTAWGHVRCDAGSLRHLPTPCAFYVLQTHDIFNCLREASPTGGRASMTAAAKPKNLIRMNGGQCARTDSEQRLISFAVSLSHVESCSTEVTHRNALCEDRSDLESSEPADMPAACFCGRCYLLSLIASAQGHLYFSIVASHWLIGRTLSKLSLIGIGSSSAAGPVNI